MVTTNSQLMMLEAERNQSMIRLKDEVRTIHHILNSLEDKLDNGRSLYDSDGLQSCGVYLDSYLGKVVAFEQSIALFQAHLDSKAKERV